MLLAFTDGAALRGTPAPPSSGLQLWLKADTGVSVSGSNVTAWADQSGNGNNYTTAAGTPQLLAPGSGINGLPAIRFTDSGSGKQNCYLTGSFSPTSWAGFSIIYVVRTSATANLSTSFDAVFNIPQQNGIWWMFAASNNGSFGGGFEAGWAGPNSSVTLGTYSPPLSNGETFAQVYRYNKSQWVLSGRLAHTVSDTSWPTAGVTTQIGTGSYANTQGTADIAEILVYDHALSDADLALVNTYLNARYGA